jgi:hypothetical protein
MGNDHLGGGIHVQKNDWPEGVKVNDNNYNTE